MKHLTIYGALATFVIAVAAPAQAQYDAYNENENGYYNEYGEDDPRYYGEQTDLWGEERDELEYEPGEGLHEEEWYDPSDWIDFDEGIEYETDYNYGDYEYGYYDDGYADDDWFYDYYDYGYDYAY